MSVGQECRARDVEAVVVDAAEHAVSGIRVVVAEEDDLDRLRFREKLVELQEAPDERECDSGLEDGILVFTLVPAVGGKPLAAVDFVGDVQAEQRTGSHCDHELVFDRECHVGYLRVFCFIPRVRNRTPAECASAGRRR